MSPAPSPGLALYRALTGLAEPFLPGVLRARARRGREDAPRLPERLARAPVERPPGRLVWLHGASVGETLSLLALAEALREAAPGLALLLTSGTVTSAELLARRAPPGVLRRLAPVDAPGAARRFVRAWRPDAAVFAESEVWPNTLGELRAAGARTALVSARLSAPSLRRWARAPRAARALFGGFDLVLAQDDATAHGLARLGARDDGRLNLKLAGGPLPVDGEALARAERALAGAPVLIAASTHPGEEEIVLDAWARLDRPAAALVIVPRHPERGVAVAELARARRLPVALRSQGAEPRAGEVHVADTLGELGLFFALARTGSVLVGGSLRDGVGGHNPLEPVRAGAPVVRGPHVANWSDVYARLGDAAPVGSDADDLARLWAADLDGPAAAASRARLAGERLGDGEPRALAAAVEAIVRLAGCGP